MEGWIYAPAQGWLRAALAETPQAHTTGDGLQPLATGREAGLDLLVPPAVFADADAGLGELVIQDLQLSMDELDAEVLFRKEPNDKSSFPMRLETEAGSLSGRVEVKGSFSRNFLKKSLVIKLASGQQWQGRRKFALNAMATDPTQLREWLAWDLVRALGMASPQVEYVRLYINGRYIGLYLQFEWITDATFERQDLGEGGQLYHPDDSLFCGELTPATLPRLEDCWFNLSPPARMGEGHAPLQQLIEAMEQTPVERFDSFLGSHFNLDSVINWLVLNAIASNGDTYNKNYFLHRSADSGRWSVVPWDYDLSFGRNADPVLPFPQNILNDNFYYLHPPDLGVFHPLKDKALQNPTLMQHYRTRMAHVLGLAREDAAEAAFGWFSPQRFIGRITQLRQFIGSETPAERYPAGTPAVVEAQVAALRWYGLMRHHHLRNLLIEPSPFGTARWMAGANYTLLKDEFPLQVPLALSVNQDLNPGESWVVPVEAWLARPLGLLHFSAVSQPARVRLELVSEQPPDLLPPGMTAADCLQRSWFLDLKTPLESLTLDLDLDYLQQSSQRHELGGIDERAGLSLWQMSGTRWQSLPTRYNSFANTLSAGGVTLHGGVVSRFVACRSRE
jgi:hypothetical protein